MGGMSNLASIGMNMALTQEARRKQDKEERKGQRRKMTELNEKTVQAEREEGEALAARIASARARAGAAGTGTTGGAIDALVRGLEENSNTEIDALRQKRKRGMDELLRQSSSGRRRNLLDLASAFTGAAPALSKRRRSLLD